MTPQEQNLIEDLFNRLAAQGRQAKDRDADRLIQQLMRDTPDAAYMLVQSAIVYQHQLAESERRIGELEDQLSAGTSSRGGSFLGGLLGGGRERGPEPAPRSAARQPEPSRSPWANPQPAPAPRQGGGFLGSALSTAAGVAGGMVLADSLRSMFGGGSSNSAHAADQAQHDREQAALADADRTQDELQDASLDDNGGDGSSDDSSYDDSLDV